MDLLQCLSSSTIFERNPMKKLETPLYQSININISCDLMSLMMKIAPLIIIVMKFLSSYTQHTPTHFQHIFLW